MAKRAMLPDPTEVLRGRARATLEQLFALIQATNPTDRGLSARQEAERYTLKARLQSLLIREHADLLQVVAEGTDGRVVSLQHRLGQRDACHARIDALDEEARSWIQAELAAAPPAPVPAPPLRSNIAPPKPAPSADPLSAGHRALEEYDFDEAARLFRDALRRPELALDAAQALLDLLVNHLADDAAALEIEPVLPTPARADALVRGRLSIAAARLGDPRARGWIRGADAESAGDALVLLADRALRETNEVELRSCLQELQERVATHPALLRLQDAWQRLRQAGRQPLEARLGAALASEAWSEVEALVRELLAGWPESEPARAAKLRLERRARDAAARDIVSRAWESWHRGEPESVLTAIRQARALSPEDPETLSWLDEAEAAAQEEVDAAEAERFGGLLGAGRLEEALAAWPRLRPEVQAELRSQHPLRELDWLDALPTGEGRVQAVLALREAELALGRGSLSTAERLLQSHSRFLRSHPVAASLQETIAALRAQAQENATALRLERLGAARAAGRLEDALALAQSLPTELRKKHKAALEAEKAVVDALRRRMRAIERGDLLEARDLAAAAGDLTAVAELRGQLRAAWRVEHHEGVNIGVSDLVMDEDPLLPLPWLTEAGDAFVHAEVYAGWVVLRLIELPSMAVRRVLLQKAPGPMLLCYTLVEGDRVTLVDLKGSLLVLRLSDGEPLRWLPRPPGLAGDEILIETTMLAPGGRFVWMSVHVDSKSELRVYDTERWPGFRLVDGFGLGIPLLGNEEPAVARLNHDKGAQVFAPNGNPLSKVIWMKDAKPTRAAIHPRGFPIALIHDASEHKAMIREKASEADLPNLAERPLGFFRTDPDRVNGTVEVMGLASLTQAHQIAASREKGTLHLKQTSLGLSHLHCFVADWEGILQDEGGPWVPVSTLLLTDARSYRVRAITRTEAGLRLIPIDDPDYVVEPTEAIPENHRVSWSDGGLQGAVHCGFHFHDPSPTAATLLRLLNAREGAARETLIADIRESQSDDPSTLLDLVVVLARLDRPDEAEALFGEIERRFPDHPRRRFLRALGETGEQSWPDVKEALEGVSFKGFDAATQQHALHLRGLARLRLGEREAGEADLREAATLEGRCDIKAALQLLDVLAGEPIPTELSGGLEIFRRRLDTLIQGILSADRHLAAEEHEAALAALDHPTTWRSRDRQALARIAEAWLGIHSGDPIRSLRRRVAFLTFLGAMELCALKRGYEIPIPPHTWGAERLADLERRVNEALLGG